MISLLRGLRNNLLAERRLTRYLLYALGEIVLVVIGILIALQVNTWNEERKRGLERLELLGALQSDLSTTRVLLDEGMAQSAKGIRRMEQFLNAVGTNPEGYPVDSLQYWAGGAFDAVFVDPVLTTYNEAVSTGRISLVQDAELLDQLASFIRANSFYQVHLNFTGEIYYLGAIYDLRRQVGNLGVLGGPVFDRTFKRNLTYPRYNLSDSEFYNLIERPENYAAIDNMLDAQYMIRDILGEMDSALKAAQSRLETLTGN